MPLGFVDFIVRWRRRIVLVFNHYLVEQIRLNVCSRMQIILKIAYFGFGQRFRQNAKRRRRVNFERLNTLCA